jgi:mRNA interferase HigB
MLVTGLDVVQRAMRKHSGPRRALERFLHHARHADWRNIGDMRRDFASADPVRVASGGTATVFNIAGNSFRLIASIDYRRGVMAVLDVLTHAEYSKDTWKDRL